MADYIVGIDIGGQGIKAVVIRKEDDVIDPNEVQIFDKNSPEKYDFEKEGIHEIVLNDVIKWITKEIDGKKGKLVGIGIGSFGPVQLNKNEKNYGFITTTPKKAWRNKPIVSHFEKAFPNIPIGFDTDVNAPALFEARFQKCENLAYITVGTGIGVGLCVNSRPVHGLIHPEGGHIRVPIHDIDRKNKYFGFCEKHREGCIEGLCAAQAIGERKGVKKGELKEHVPQDDEVYEIVSWYLSHLCCSLLYLLSLEKIVISGGIMNNPNVLPKIREFVPKFLNGYLDHRNYKEGIENVIVGSQVHPFSGVYGALELARRKIENL